MIHSRPQTPLEYYFEMMDEARRFKKAIGVVNPSEESILKLAMGTAEDRGKMSVFMAGKVHLKNHPEDIS